MIAVLYILLGLLLFYLLFLFGPAVSMFFIVFSRKQGREPEEIPPEHICFGPYLDRMKEAAASLRAVPSRRITLEAEDGTMLAADRYGTGDRPLVLCMHGYRSSPITNFCVQGMDLLNEGFDLLLIHQRAHGDSRGKRSTLGLLEREDLLRWIDWAQRESGAAPLFLYGVSMGAASIALAADRIRPESVGAMVLESCYSSPYAQMLSDCRKWHLPARPMMAVFRLCAKALLGLELRDSACEALARTRIPAFFLHGTADTTVRLEDGKKCYEACGSEKELMIVEGAQHTVAYIAGGGEAKDRVCRFFRRSMEIKLEEE